MIMASTQTRRLHGVIAATLLALAAAPVSAQTQPPLDLRLRQLPDPQAGERIATPDQQVVDTGTSVHGSFSTGIGYSKNYGNSTVTTADLDVSKQYDSGRAIDLHDTQFAFDGMHLTPEGNRRMAEVLAAALLALRPGGPR